ncbi:MAG: hypothetical protein OHK0022_58440 [Roseiflexaceae bacterium]
MPPVNDGGTAPQPVPTTTSSAAPTRGVVTPNPGGGDDPEPTPASIERKVAIEAPKRMEQGSTANLYLSFGAPERRANLPGSAGSQQSSSPAMLPATGVVQPGLNVPGNVRVEAVDVEPVSVENAIPKRWHWRITVSKDEPATEPVVISPYLKYSETPGGASRVIWPEQDLALTIEVTQPPVRQRLMSFIGDASATLQLFGVSVVMLIAWIYSFGKWVWPRLNGKTEDEPAKAEAEATTPNA